MANYYMTIRMAQIKKKPDNENIWQEYEEKEHSITTSSNTKLYIYFGRQVVSFFQS